MEQRTVRIQPAERLIIDSGSFCEEEEGWGYTTGSDDNWRSMSMVMEPMLTQPGLGITTTTVTTITQTGGGWSTGLFDISADGTTCILGAVFPCCLAMNVSHQYGESFCLPLLPGSTLAVRVGIRERYKIRGSVCEDWLTLCCCYPLAICQMIREMRRRMKSQTYQVSTTLECS